MKTACALVLVCLLSLPALASAEPDDARAAAHRTYAETLWSYLHEHTYTNWSLPAEAQQPTSGPGVIGPCRLFTNVPGVRADEFREGAVLVAEHLSDDGQTVMGITAWRKTYHSYYATSDGWYWAHWTPDGQVVMTSADQQPWSKPNFAVLEDEDALWVFGLATHELLEFMASGEWADAAVREGAGPNGRTLKAPDQGTLRAYLAATEGFVTRLDHDRLWVFRANSPALVEFARNGHLSMHVERSDVGPDGMTLQAPDADTLDAYLGARL